MSCCCRSSDGNVKKGGKRKNAPSDQPMERAMTEDQQVLARWRDKRNSSIDEQDDSASQDPLHQPYEIMKQPPLQPKNGNILKPDLMEVMPKISTSPKSAFERFVPEVQKSGVISTIQQTNTDHIGEERIVSIISHDEKSILSSEQNIDLNITSGTSNEKAKEDANILRAVTDTESSAASSQAEQQSLVREEPLGKVTAHKNESTQSTPNTRRRKGDRNDDEEDHLSDVGSDVDSVTRDRYLLACKMLKSRLIEKEKSLDPTEREFLLSLLADVQAEADVGSVASVDQVSAIESAALRLDKQTVLRNDQVEINVMTPLSGETSASEDEDEDSDSDSYDDEESEQPAMRQFSKNPHTAARKRSTFAMATNLCGPRSAKKKENATEIVLLVKEEDDFEEGTSFEGSSTRDDGLVRIDGWSHHKSMEYPFRIIGTTDERYLNPRVLTPSMMEAFRGFLPYRVTESNFWLKFSLVRDGASIDTLLATVRASTYTIIAVETNHGEVFGAFCGTPWRAGNKWFGNGESFLWRMKKSRLVSARHIQEDNFENEMEVYPYTGYDALVQYCTSKTLAVGGGDWDEHASPFENEPKGIGFMVDGDLAGGETNSCATFANPRLCKNVSTSNEFVIDNLEVWTLTPFDNEKDAAQLEIQKLYIEENARRGRV